VSTTRNRIARITTGATATVDAWNPNMDARVVGIIPLTAGRGLAFGFFTSVANHLINGGTRMAVLDIS
jgi:hypothetical protein